MLKSRRFLSFFLVFLHLFNDSEQPLVAIKHPLLLESGFGDEDALLVDGALEQEHRLSIMLSRLRSFWERVLRSRIILSRFRASTGQVQLGGVVRAIAGVQ